MINKKPIYLDYNASTPIDPKVLEVMLPYFLDHYGNPSSYHVFGSEAKKGIEKARQQVANMINCNVDEVVFTSGGTEANNYAIKGIAEAYKDKGRRIITTAVEHPAVLEVCKHLKADGYEIIYLPVDKYGMINPDELSKAITPQTILISVMHANNEIGTIEPIEEISIIAKKNNIVFHTDAAQSVGKIPVDVEILGVDLLSIAGHKLYAPKGVGALYIRSGINLQKIIEGAGQEINRRAGTENVASIVGLGKAAELVTQKLENHSDHLLKLRKRFEKDLDLNINGIKINGHPEKRLPNTSSISFKGVAANLILSEMDGIAASAGAACHSDGTELSGVLQAIGLPVEYAMGTIRFSVGRFTTEAEIKHSVDEIVKVLSRLKKYETFEPVMETGGEIKLTRFTQGMGCACKLRPQLLESILKKIPVLENENILIGPENYDDAAVYKISESQAVVQTVDFFTPVVDDPFQFGAIAAANSLSDIYAMGAEPLFALNIVGFPSTRLPAEILEQILAGAQSKTEEAGVSILGGHTIDDQEPKYGLAVTGIVNPGEIIANKNAKAGDKLVLTKPIGTGILSTALKKGMLNEERTKVVTANMLQLNRVASEIMREFNVNACTDVTGFGLLGHLLEMMNASGTSAIVESTSVPLLDGVFETAAAGIVPGGTDNNYKFTEASVEYDPRISDAQKLILNDAQTSGGLLISVDAAEADDLIKAMQNKNLPAAIVGEVTSVQKYKIKIRR